MYLKFIYKY